MSAKNIVRAITPPALLDFARSIIRPCTTGAGNNGQAAITSLDDGKFARAQKYGLNAERYKAFMENPDGATTIGPLYIYGANKQVKFPSEARWFIIESMFEDVYFLEKLPLDQKANLKIIDIGANAGAFIVAARNRFPMATMHCYEPNLDMEEYLSVQAFATRSKVYLVGVGKEAGSFAIDSRQMEVLGNDSVMMLNFTKTGNIPVIPFQECLDNIGGYADLVKLDCEGSEWIITSDPKPFKNVRFLAMEYHRFPLDGSFDEFDLGVNIHEHAKARIRSLNFDVLHQVENSMDAGIIVAQNNAFSTPLST